MSVDIERFEDYQILKFEIPGFDKLTLNQKLFVYHLAQSGIWGRDIFYDQNFAWNLELRRVLETIFKTTKAFDFGVEGAVFQTFMKKFWFSNGLHHHYESAKFHPEFSERFFKSACEKAGITISNELFEVLFDQKIASKKVEKAAEKDLVIHSAVNFYGPGITQKEVESFYQTTKKAAANEPLSFGLNSKLQRNSAGIIEEAVYKVGGIYGKALEKIVEQLALAQNFAETPCQAKAIELLIAYYKTGDLKFWDAFNIEWVQCTGGQIDFIHGFVEVYEDPLSRKGTFECIVQIKDPEATEKMKTITENIAWFESASPIDAAFKKETPQGISYAIMNVAFEAGDAAPATPIGVNLPNADWIRAKYGSKSVSLANIEAAYDLASGSSLLEEFCFDAAEKQRAIKWGTPASKLHTALHEVIGHGSGKLAPGVGTPKETLKNYANTIEEARADLVALYFMGHPYLQTLGLVPDADFYKSEYEQYIRNGLMLQLRRVTKGAQIEEDHMRNRQLVAQWVYEKGRAENVIERVVKNGNTYFKVNDFNQLQGLFGKLLQEVQRIKSTGDFQAARDLVEAFGVQVDSDLHQEVLDRVAPLDLPKFYGFVQPEFNLIMNDGAISDVVLGWPQSFAQQMLEYSNKYGIL